MDRYLLHRIIFRICHFIAAPFLRLKFRYSYDPIPDVKGPYLLLANHNTDFDPLFIGLACPTQMYFVATEKILRMGFLSALVMALFRPIIHYKGKTGISSVKEILQKLKEGKNVALFPEGNRSFNGLTGSFVPATGKMAKRSGAALITYRLHGGYFTSPRWGVGLRRGRMRGELARVYTPDDLKNMSEKEINEAIRKDLHIDAYAEQERDPIPYEGTDLALGLESTLFACPKCGKISALRSTGNMISCTVCDFSAEYDVYGYLKDKDGRKYTITELDDRQRKLIKELAALPPEELLFRDSVTAETIGNSHEVTEKETLEIRAYSDRLEIGERSLPYESITGMAINQRNLLILHCADGSHLELSGPISFSALKYLYLYQSTGNTNE